MSVLVFCSADGGAGVTSSLVAIGAHWRERNAVVVELNRRGGNLGAWAGVADNLGTASLAAARWDGNHDDLLTATWGTLSNGLPALCGPTRQSAASGVVDYLAAKILDAANANDTVLLVDAGVLDTNAVPHWINAADAIVVVTRQDPRSATVTATRLERVGELVDATRSAGIDTFAMTVGEQPFNVSEVASFLDVTTLALADDPTGAALLTQPDANRRSVDRSAITRSARIPGARLAYASNANLQAAAI